MAIVILSIYIYIPIILYLSKKNKGDNPSVLPWRPPRFPTAALVVIPDFAKDQDLRGLMSSAHPSMIGPPYEENEAALQF